MLIWASFALAVAGWVRRGEFFKVRWRPGEETWVALALGLAAILLSAAMLPFGPEARLKPVGILLRDVSMVLGCGLVIPTWYVLLHKRGSWQDLGLTRENLGPSLGLGAVTGFFISLGLLLGGRRLALDAETLKAVVALLPAGIFEAVLYYGFLRTALAKAFGRLPAVFVGAGLYALHHVGFQLPFEADPAGKLAQLFLVGIMMQSVTSITGNLLTYFPLAYLPGVSADVLLNPEMVRRIARSLPRELVLLGCMVAWVAVVEVLRRRGGRVGRSSELTARTVPGYDGNNRLGAWRMPRRR